MIAYLIPAKQDSEQTGSMAYPADDLAPYAARSSTVKEVTRVIQAGLCPTSGWIAATAHVESTLWNNAIYLWSKTKHKTAVSPLLIHWRYHSCTLSQWHIFTFVWHNSVWKWTTIHWNWLTPDNFLTHCCGYQWFDIDVSHDGSLH